MDEEARPATLADLDDLAALAGVAADEVATLKGGPQYLAREARPAPYRETLSASLEAPGERTIVGTIDGVIVGFAAARTEELRTGERIAELTEIYVMDEARGVSIGELMLAEVMAWARDQGCSALEGSVHPGNRHAKNFFETAGMVTRLLRVSTDLVHDG